MSQPNSVLKPSDSRNRARSAATLAILLAAACSASPEERQVFHDATNEICDDCGESEILARVVSPETGDTVSFRRLKLGAMSVSGVLAPEQMELFTGDNPAELYELLVGQEAPAVLLQAEAELQLLAGENVSLEHRSAAFDDNVEASTLKRTGAIFADRFRDGSTFQRDFCRISNPRNILCHVRTTGSGVWRQVRSGTVAAVVFSHISSPRLCVRVSDNSSSRDECVTIPPNHVGFVEVITARDSGLLMEIRTQVPNFPGAPFRTMYNLAVNRS